MLIKRKKHTVPTLDATSTADISFMLLTFFLVTTSMDSDKGLIRQLPPADTENNTETPIVARENLMMFKITSSDQILLNDTVVSTTNLRNDISEFIKTRGDKHSIAIDAAPSSSYETYFRLQNEIAAAYGMVRDDVARRNFSRSYRQCNEDEREYVRNKCRERIVEIYDQEGGMQHAD